MTAIRQQVLGNILFAAIALVILVARTWHILFR
jgi:hypothetical protein